MRIAFVFPGQGSQSVGMLGGFADNETVRGALARADEALGFSIERLIAEGPAEEKLASFLLSAARPDGKNGWVFEAPSLTRLASSLSVGRATLYRALDAFEQSGVIQREGRLLRIPDITRLNPAEGMGRP